MALVEVPGPDPLRKPETVVLVVSSALAVVDVGAGGVDVTPVWSPDAGSGGGRTKMYNTRVPTNRTDTSRVDGRIRSFFILEDCLPVRLLVSDRSFLPGERLLLACPLA